mmetsp:Transcript_108045/g.337969  ORF Transcript_108045/g.337969 Transcript_108045/m.337969 type:complete len:137 (-) Transcript_108045:60-470(-)
MDAQRCNCCLGREGKQTAVCISTDCSRGGGDAADVMMPMGQVPEVDTDGKTNIRKNKITNDAMMVAITIAACTATSLLASSHLAIAHAIPERSTAAACKRLITAAAASRTSHESSCRAALASGSAASPKAPGDKTT